MSGEKDRNDFAKEPLVIWRLVDGKRGHENQSLGLCNALATKIEVRRYDIPAAGRVKALFYWLAGRYPTGEKFPTPDIAIGAGHATHFDLLAARRRHGCRVTVIMKPSLPASLFDLCIVPEHDRVAADNCFQTRGVMNVVNPQSVARDSQTLFLIGGVSRHYLWDSQGVLDQVEAIVREQPDRLFVLSDSRRTPAEFMVALEKLDLPNLRLYSWRRTGPDWVAGQLAKSGSVWVSEESVSMVYEAVTSGASVGLIAVKAKAFNRVAEGVRSLVDEGWATPFERWLGERRLPDQPGPFNEAARCAEWMLGEWL